MRQKKWNVSLMIGSVLVGLLVLIAVIGVFYTPYDTTAMNPEQKLMAPSLTHIMGTDNFGRDIFSRSMEGMRTTCFVAFCTVMIGGLVGGIVGAITGYFGGWVDEILMRLNDALASFPSILLALIIVSVLGNGTTNIMIALSIVFIPSFARLVRAEIMKIKVSDYVKSARLMGVSHGRIMLVHLLPNIIPVFLTGIMVGFNNAVLAEAGMSYLGLGVQPPNASLGRMLSEGQGYLTSAPWYPLFPGLIMIILILGVVLVSDGLAKRNR